jgi:dihydroorotase
MSGYLVRNVRIVNEGRVFDGELLLQGENIVRVSEMPIAEVPPGTVTIDGQGAYLMPGMIDDQVHFREPGLTQKADIASESAAAVAGGITSFMEMPNTVPNTLTQELLQDKYDLAAAKSMANYSFYMGASNDNLAEVLKTDPKTVCGVKVFMGSSTGNMLVDSEKTLRALFAECPLLIATHCEDEQTIRQNTSEFVARYGNDMSPAMHPLIRSAEACYRSSAFAVALATEYNARLHILHLSTARELGLFRNDISLREKRITAEVCIHHLWFSDADYAEKGNFIKWNPAVKAEADRQALWAALLDNRLDVLATDHAPHTLAEKSLDYRRAPSGGPLVQHALTALVEQTLYHRSDFGIERLVEKFAHAPADMFGVVGRGYLRSGYKADMVLVHPDAPWTVQTNNLRYKCGWSPFEGYTFRPKVLATWVNGRLAYDNLAGADLGIIADAPCGERLQFER